MKNLTKLIAGIGLVGSLGGGCGEEERKSPYNEITLIYDYSGGSLTKISAGGFKKGDNCAWSSINFEDINKDGFYEKIWWYHHISRDSARYQQIELNKEKKTMNYHFYSMKHSLDNCQWEGIENNILEIKNGKKEDFETKLLAQLTDIINMKRLCNDDWKFFLNKEYEKSYAEFSNKLKMPSGEQSKGIISRYQIVYSKFEDNLFPKLVQIYAKDKNNNVLCALNYEDAGRNKAYTSLKLLNYNYQKEEINTDYSTRKITYLKSSPNFPRFEVEGKSERYFYLQYPELQKRINEIKNVKIDCENNNELVPFLYVENMLEEMRLQRENRAWDQEKD